MKKFSLPLLCIFFIKILIAQPSNDDACNSIILTIDDDCSATLPYDNTDATIEPGEPIGNCYEDGSIGKTVWFAFVAPASGAVSINTDFSNSGLQDSQVSVYELTGGDCSVLFNFSQIACNEDRMPNPINTQFNAAIPPISVIAGQTYYIQVDGFNADGGDAAEGSFCIIVTEENPPPNDDCTNAEVYGGFGSDCTKIFTGTTSGATDNNDFFTCDITGFNNASVYYTINAAVSEVEFNLLSGENINVALFTNDDLAFCSNAVEVSGNCFTDIDTSTEADPIDPNVLFTNLIPGSSYLMAIWTDEGEATDFEFCLTQAPTYTCGDGECYELAENYADCPEDCSCISSVDLYSHVTGENTSIPEAVCPEIAGDITDPDNLGLYIPFNINTDDQDLAGSSVTTNIGTLFLNTSPPTPLPNSEAANFLMYVFLTEAELTAGGSVTITFTSDDEACTTSVTFDIADLIGPDTSECGGCDLNVVPDYANAFCSDINSVNLTLGLENFIGPNVWISLDGNTTTTYNPISDILIALDGSTTFDFPTSNLTLFVFDEGNPNCAVMITFMNGGFICSGEAPCITDDGSIATVCQLNPIIANQEATCNPDGTLAVPIDVGNSTGAVTFTPAGIISGSGSSEDPYTTNIDLNNCQPIDFIISDESTCDNTPTVTVNSPASIAGGIVVSTNADDWGVQINDELAACGTEEAFTGTIAIVNDEDTSGGQLTDFCEPTPPTLPNPSVCANIAGKIALIDRGQCNFSQKVENAQNCGAIGVIICNCQPGPAWCAATDDVLITMGAGIIVNPITIPAVFMLYSDCQELKAELNNGNEVEICFGPSETISGCERTFTLDVCDDYPADFCQNPDVSGCTDPGACNYNPDATIDDGSCILTGETCDDGDCSTENDEISGVTCECEGTPIQCPPDETFNLVTCICEATGPCEEDISGSVTAPDPLCVLSDISIIITAPDGTTTTVSTDADGNFTVPNGPYPCGTYTATFEDVSLLPECYTNTGSTDSITFEVDGDPNTDDGPNFVANPTIPTLSQWGLIVLALLLMIFGALRLSLSTLQNYRFTNK